MSVPSLVPTIPEVSSIEDIWRYAAKFRTFLLPTSGSDGTFSTSADADMGASMSTIGSMKMELFINKKKYRSET